MRLILLTLMVCAGSLAADLKTATEPELMNDLRSKPKAAKSKRSFHPLRLIHRLGKAESELAFRLSSWGIQREVDAGKSDALPRPSPLTEASTPHGLSGASQ